MEGSYRSMVSFVCRITFFENWCNISMFQNITKFNAFYKIVQNVCEYLRVNMNRVDARVKMKRVSAVLRARVRPIGVEHAIFPGPGVHSWESMMTMGYKNKIIFCDNHILRCHSLYLSTTYWLTNIDHIELHHIKWYSHLLRKIVPTVVVNEAT